MSDNLFLNKVYDRAETWNAAASNATTKSALLDYFAKAGTYRRELHEVYVDISACWAENPLLTLSTIMYLRNVSRKTWGFETVQKGQGNFALNRYIASQESWHESTIRDRALNLAEIAFDIWQRPAVTEISDREDDPTGHKPTRFTLLGEEYMVETWREILLTVIELLVTRHGAVNFMNRTTNVVGSKRRYVAYTPEGMTNGLPLADTGLWVETNLGSRSILSIVNQMVAACGHNKDDFEAYWI